MTVTASTGDAGITSTIGNPLDRPERHLGRRLHRLARCTSRPGTRWPPPFGNGKWLDNNTSSLSSAGITQDGRTIDIEAPGEADWAVCDDGGNFAGCASYNPAKPLSKIESFGGTSQSAPLTAGVAALVIQAYRKTHGGTSPAPAVVKKIITSTARDLGLPGDEQGSGLIDARAAVEAALTWPGASSAAPAAAGSNIALSQNQLTLTGQPGRTKTGSVTVTNVGTKTQSIVASTRRYALLSQAAQTTALDTSSAQTTPYPTTGAPWVYKKLTFTVPSGADELGATIRWQSGAAFGGAGPVVRLSLFTPDGTYAGNTRPQGGANPANYGLTTIKQPAAGTWTAVLYTPVDGRLHGQRVADRPDLPGDPGGPGLAQHGHPRAGRSPRRSRPRCRCPTAAATRSPRCRSAAPAATRSRCRSSLRALIPTGSRPGTFGGTITGGNARSYSPAQTFSYGFDVPRGKRDVQVTTTLPNQDDLLEGVLIDPNGEVQSVNSNQLADGQTSMANTVAKPIAGRWRYVVVVQSPVSGKALVREPSPARWRSTGSRCRRRRSRRRSRPGRRSPASSGSPTHGQAPMFVQTDARRGGMQQLQLAPQFAGSTLQLPQSVDDLSQLPSYLVPPNTGAIALTASTTSPAQVELNAPLGGIDVFGDLTAAQGGNTVSTASVAETKGTVGLGYWGAYVQQIGPFGDGGAPKATSVLSATATTKRFDDAVTSSTGDPFLPAVDPTADAGSPLEIAPGQTEGDHRADHAHGGQGPHRLRGAEPGHDAARGGARLQHHR